jgi:hypothetical protein
MSLASKRHIFAGAAAISLAACIVLCVMWVRSHFREDKLAFATDFDGDGTESQHTDESIASRRPAWSAGFWHEEWTVDSAAGNVVFSRYRNDQTAGMRSGWGPDGWNLSSDDDPTASSRWPSYSHVRTSTSAITETTISIRIPYWLMLLAVAWMPALFAISFFRRRQLLNHESCCSKCGYDCRATPNRCPECGASPTSAAPHSKRFADRAKNVFSKVAKKGHGPAPYCGSENID